MNFPHTQLFSSAMKCSHLCLERKVIDISDSKWYYHRKKCQQFCDSTCTLLVKERQHKNTSASEINKNLLIFKEVFSWICQVDHYKTACWNVIAFWRTTNFSNVQINVVQSLNHSDWNTLKFLHKSQLVEVCRKKSYLNYSLRIICGMNLSSHCPTSFLVVVCNAVISVSVWQMVYIDTFLYGSKSCWIFWKLLFKLITLTVCEYNIVQ